MGNISFTQGIYNPSDSFLHKLDPRSKIIGSLMQVLFFHSKLHLKDIF